MAEENKKTAAEVLSEVGDDFSISTVMKLVQAISSMGIFQGILLIISVLMIIGAAIANYFTQKNKREEHNFTISEEARKKELERLIRMQQDTMVALVSNIKAAEQQDYQYYIRKINEKDFAPIFAKNHVMYHDQIGSIVYDDNFTAEQRSAKIVAIARK